MRIGLGYDVHRLVEGRPLILGGVRVASPLGLQGHSDADVLTHAVVDALLGAAALGDIGAHFPDTDEAWRGADSLALLRAVVEKVAARGFGVGNVDVTVVLQRPKLRSHIDAMRSNLAEAMGIEVGRVSVKATTGEGMGFVGREEGAAAHAVALLTPRSGPDGT
ncbi:MAG: 2-C-methyl-D-erythritol 2,4-cyclodiphosphate synthase [Rubricoccaceae bacterium]|nr:2-C-methyl-D-erythritol 2,4-cyclodiphosphate synthase [Rubricoccaceae bacterium]